MWSARLFRSRCSSNVQGLAAAAGCPPSPAAGGWVGERPAVCLFSGPVGFLPVGLLPGGAPTLWGSSLVGLLPGGAPPWWDSFLVGLLPGGAPAWWGSSLVGVGVAREEEHREGGQETRGPDPRPPCTSGELRMSQGWNVSPWWVPSTPGDAAGSSVSRESCLRRGHS